VLLPQAAEENPVRILVVEDNPSNLQVVLMVLRALGYLPDIAENGRDGLEKAQVGKYDLILLDVYLPDIDGLTLTRKIREQAPNPRPTIIAITATVTAEARKKCFEAGMDDFVMKPFKISTLKDIILKYARKAKSEA